MNQELDTGFMLLMRYRSPIITLDQTVKDWLPHISPEVAKRRANVQSLPFPVFRADNSKKSPWLVNLADLAAWLEKSQAEAARDWQKVNG